MELNLKGDNIPTQDAQRPAQTSVGVGPKSAVGGGSIILKLVEITENGEEILKIDKDYRVSVVLLRDDGKEIVLPIIDGYAQLSGIQIWNNEEERYYKYKILLDNVGEKYGDSFNFVKEYDNSVKNKFLNMRKGRIFKITDEGIGLWNFKKYAERIKCKLKSRNYGYTWKNEEYLKNEKKAFERNIFSKKNPKLPIHPRLPPLTISSGNKNEKRTTLEKGDLLFAEEILFNTNEAKYRKDGEYQCLKVKCLTESEEFYDDAFVWTVYKGKNCIEAVGKSISIGDEPKLGKIVVKQHENFGFKIERYEEIKNDFELYNLVWIKKRNPGDIAAIILYPALLTPEIIFNGGDIELLLLVEDGCESIEHRREKLKKAINKQLKITKGIDPEKKCSVRELSGGNKYEIEMVDVVDDYFQVIKDERPEEKRCKFSGIIDKRALKVYFLLREIDANTYNKIFKKIPLPTPDSNPEETCLGKILKFNYDFDSKKNSYKLNDDLNDDDAIELLKFFKDVLKENDIKFENYKNLYFVKLKNLPIEKNIFQNQASKNNTSRESTLVDSVRLYEEQDRFIKSVLNRLNGRKLEEKGKYCFYINEDDVSISQIDKSNPILSYHPIFFYKEPRYFNFGHMADLHISSRQQLLSKSKARVIEYIPEKIDPEQFNKIKDNKINDYYRQDGDNYKLNRELNLSGEDESRIQEILERYGIENNSPKIGSMINVSSKNVKKALDIIGMDEKIDILLIGGDLVDHIKNTFVNKEMCINEIWKTVELSIWGFLGDFNKEKYQAYVDYISFYSLIIYFYMKYEKPIFVVSGNHDAYFEPYGISPRPLWVRGNEGIPADHNLTFYEAILAFGKTYDEVYKMKAGIHKEQFEWFYSILTPFADFTLELPKQILVGLSWGDDEDILFGGQDWKHLPRSDEAISKKQYDLLINILKNTKEKKIILMTHFTFVSYKEDIPLEFEKENNIGKIECESDLTTRYTDFEMGTFESNREIYKELDTMQCILTGHSHRRGLYKISVQKDSNEASTYFCDFNDFNDMLHGEKLSDDRKNELSLFPLFNYKNTPPTIIVSDSLGPLPRYNKSREFSGWGSDCSSFTKLIFNSSGKIKSIQSVPISEKPRFVVALDYFDILKEDVIKGFKTVNMSIKSDRGGYLFNLSLNSEISKIAEIEKMSIYSKAFEKEQDAWIWLILDSDNNKLMMEKGQDEDNFSIKLKIIRDEMQNLLKKSDNFLSIKFKPKIDWLKNQYDFDSCWNFKFQLDTEELFLGAEEDPTSVERKVKYIIKRDKDDAEKPDFDWYEKNFKKYKRVFLEEGRWTDVNDVDQDKDNALYGELVNIYIKTKEIPDGSPLDIKIYEHDAVFNDFVLSKKGWVDNNEVKVELELIPSLFIDSGKEAESNFFFIASVSHAGRTIEERFPPKKEDFLKVKAPSFVEGKWLLNKSGDGLTIKNSDNIEWIRIEIKTKNAIEGTQVKIEIYEDLLGFDKKIFSASGEVIGEVRNHNNVDRVEILIPFNDLKENLVDKDVKKEHKLYFKAFFIGYEIEKEFPESSNDYLKIET